MTLDQALRLGAQRLQSSPSPRLDAEVLLMHVLGVDRTWLYTWGDRILEDRHRLAFEALLADRALGRPVAHLVGRREFWGLELDTSNATLIPRPDTERLVEAALDSSACEHGSLLDLGTGTGAVALAFASERPGWRVTGTDLSPKAVELARGNATRLIIANAEFLVSDWFAALGDCCYTVIVSNPPYIAEGDPHLSRGDVRFEPVSALVADDHGFAALEVIIEAAPAHLIAGGWLWLEHGFEQAAGVRERLERRGFVDVATLADLGGRERVTGARWSPSAALD